MTNETKHTSEPWAVRLIETDDGQPVYFVIGPESECTISVYNRLKGKKPFLRAEAHARRIAACVNACVGIDNPEGVVPELLEALESILLAIQDAQQRAGVGPSDWEGRAQAAIAKARGETKGD